MITLNCPSCGAPIVFRSKASVFAVCSYCKSTLVRHDMNLENVGKMGELQDEMTPIQIGTSGFFDGKSFDVIGRLKVSYEDGSWNEWYTISNKGEEAWLAEAQGFYAMCMPVGPAAGFPLADGGVPEPSRLKAGLEVNLPHGYGSFLVDDIHEVFCKYSEGELPVNASQGRASLSVDLRGNDGAMASIEYAQGKVRLFVGSYQDFDLFKFKNLRKLDGW